MKRKFKKYEPKQMLLLPPALDEWLPQDHLAYFISELVDEIDLSEILESYESDGRGSPPYHPAMMTKLLFYAYSVGLPSSRKIEKRTFEDVAFRLLAAGAHPDHDTIATFRKQNLKALSEIFVQVLLVCHKAGIVKLGHVALDGTKVKANASKHKAMSYGRMCKKEEELELEVRELLKKAEEIDELEDSHYGKNRRGDEVPEELRFRKSRLKKIREAKAELEEEAQKKAEVKRKEIAEKKAVCEREDKKPRGPIPKDPTDDVAPKAQRNFTDPESRIMKDGSTGAYVQAYNAQAAVDSHSQVIVSADVTNEANDKRQVKPLTEQIEKNLGVKPAELSADAGYYSSTNVGFLEDEQIDAFIATERKKHSVKDSAVPRGRIPRDLSVKDRMERKLLTKRGKSRYDLRKVVVEPVFGQIKSVRGFRAFLLRGLENVRLEWRLICLGHNIMKLFRSGFCFSP